MPDPNNFFDPTNFDPSLFQHDREGWSQSGTDPMRDYLRSQGYGAQDGFDPSLFERDREGWGSNDPMRDWMRRQGYGQPDTQAAPAQEWGSTPQDPNSFDTKPATPAPQTKFTDPALPLPTFVQKAVDRQKAAPTTPTTPTTQDTLTNKAAAVSPEMLIADAGNVREGFIQTLPAELRGPLTSLPSDIAGFTGALADTGTALLGEIGGAINNALAPTQGDELTAPLRDLPVLGPVTRAGEAFVGALGATGRVIAEPLGGLAEIGLQSAVAQIPGGERADIHSQAGTTNEELSRLLARPFDPGNFDRLEEIGRTKFAAMGIENPWTMGISVLFDPLSYTGSGAVKPVQTLQRSRAMLEASIPIAKAAEHLNPAERLLFGLLKATPKFDTQGFAALKDLGMPAVSDSKIVNRITHLYTPTAKATAYIKDAVDTLGAIASDGVNSSDELLTMLERGASKAEWAQFGQRQPGLMARGGQRLQSVIEGFDTAPLRTILDDGNRIFDNIAMNRQGPNAAANSRAFFNNPQTRRTIENLPGPLRDAVEAYQGRRGMPLSLDEARTRFDKAARYWIVSQFTEHAAKVVASQSGIAPANFLTRWTAFMRKYEALAYITASPHTIAVNAISNTVGLGLKGINPFERGADIEKFLARFGTRPLDIGTDAVGYAERIAKETRGIQWQHGSLAGSIPDWASKIPLAQAYNKAEEGARLRAWVSGVRRTLNRNWRVGKWIPVPDANLTTALDAIDPTLSKKMGDLLRNAVTREEVLKIENELLNGITINSHWDEAARSLSQTWSAATGNPITLNGAQLDSIISGGTRDALEQMVQRVGQRVANGQPFNVAFDAEATALRARMASHIGGNVPSLADVIREVKQQGPASFLNPQVSSRIEAAVAHDLIEAMRTPIARNIAQQAAAPGRVFDATTRTLLRNYLQGQVLPALTDGKLAANAVGRNLVAHTVLNYDNRWNIDELMTFAMPFPFWWVHMMFNLGQDFLDVPALLTSYVRLRTMMDETNNDPSIPPRMRGKLSIDVPFIPAWLGGEVLVDPLATLAPYDQIYKVDQLKRAQFSRQQAAQRAGVSTPGAMAPTVASNFLQTQTGDPNAARILKALQTGLDVPAALALAKQIQSAHSAALRTIPIDQANTGAGALGAHTAAITGYGEVINELEARANGTAPSPTATTAPVDPEEQTTEAPTLDPIGNLLSFHAPYQVLWHLMHGENADAENILAQIPAMRILRGATAIARELGAKGLPAGGVAPFKGSLDDVYVERQLGSMRAEGLLTQDELRIALLERERNPHWQDALQRSGLADYAVPALTGATGFTGKAWTAGERKYYSTRLERDKMWEQELARYGSDPNLTREGKYEFLKARGAFEEGQPLQVWREQHPELDYGTINDQATEEEQYRAFLTDNIWERVMGMPRLQFELLKGDLGDDFYNLFFKKDTRDYSKVSSSKLAGWAQRLDIYLPVPANWSAPAPELFGLTKATDEQVQRYQTFYDSVENSLTWARVGELTGQYVDAKKQGDAAVKQFFDTPAGQQLSSFWRARDRYYLENPDVAAILQKAGAIEKDEPKTPAERLQNWMAGAIWEEYNGLSALDKRLLNSQFGATFQSTFLDKTHRDYNAAGLKNLLTWGTALGVDLPNIPRGTIPEFDAGIQTSNLRKATPDQAQRYEAFTAKLDQAFPNIQAPLSQYASIQDANAKRAFLQQAPQVQQYFNAWNWFYTNNPDIEALLIAVGARKSGTNNTNSSRTTKVYNEADYIRPVKPPKPRSYGQNQPRLTPVNYYVQRLESQKRWNARQPKLPPLPPLPAK